MSGSSQPVRVRFAPSPTGRMHLGSARTALYDYLLAQQTGGKFVLRIEDTDRKRLVQGAEEELMDGLRWLGLEYDEGPDVGGPFGPYRQSERTDIYNEHAQKLIDQGHAYYCFCTPDRLEQMRHEQQKRKENLHYDGFCRNLDPDDARRRVASGERHVIRFKSPAEGQTKVGDLLRGEIVVENSTIDDYVLVKSDGYALYHLAAMVDDHLMKITHVIRGSEWLPSLPLHSLIHQAFGWEEPKWVHLSVFLKPSGKGKMSKREAADLMKDGYSIFVKDLNELGYVPEAVVNWIALMGWSYDDKTEFFTMKDLIEKFSLEHLNPAPAAINFTKFDHFNGLHIRSLNIPDLAVRTRPFFEKHGYHPDEGKLLMVAKIIQQRIGTLDEVADMAGFFFKKEISPDIEDLIPAGMTPSQVLDIAQKSYAILSLLPEITPLTAEEPLRELVEKTGFKAGQVFGILRVAITGQKVSPPLFETMEIMGQEQVLRQIERAVRLLKTISDGEAL